MAGPLMKKKSIMINRSFLIVLVLAAFALGIFADRLFLLITGQGDELEGRSAGVFVPPGRELTQFRTKVNDLAKLALASHDVTSVSVYFLYLKTGSGFGIRESERFAPHNLLKLPVMIAYFKLAETSPDILQKKLTFTGRTAVGATSRLKTPRPLERGKTYTAGDLIYHMIVYNDDDALSLLTGNLPQGALDKLYEDLGLEIDPSDEEDIMSLSAYASFYRTLYDGTYLNRRMSDKALRYLSKASFRDGIVAGTPPDVTVASRFGDFPVSENDGEGHASPLQLHEIGIVFHPGRPYILGIITRGSDFPAQTRIIRDISSFIYREVDQPQRDRIH